MFGLPLLLAVAVSAQEPVSRSTHKLRVSDPKQAERIIAAGGRRVADYGAFQILQIPAKGPALAAARGDAVAMRNDLDVIQLNAGPIDTVAVAPARAAARKLAAPEGKRLHLVHFAGPVKPEWVDELRKTGVEIVTYIPNNAYLVYGDAPALSKVQAPAAKSALATFRDWDGPYLDSDKTDPTAKTIDAAGNRREIGTEYFAVQLVADEAVNPATVEVIKGIASGDLLRSEPSLNYYNVIAPLPADKLADIAARPDVISIQPYFLPRKFDERQNQIIAGNLSGSVPSGAGYLAWVESMGFTQNQFTLSGFAVDVTDSGVDNGTPSPNHFGLYQFGTRPGTSRVIYNRLEGNPNTGSSISGVDGHGNLNAHIIGGFNNLTGAPHQDASGYRYGLGVAPYVRLGSSVIFDPNNFTFPNYQNMLARGYRDGARISSNSWGANTSGAYSTDAQSYDALVRDAQPATSSNPTAGNQEMVIVFANGNSGSGAGTVGSPATGKNVISVGAAENVQAFGGSDGSGIGDTGADNANDIISFSSRGPCADGRIKPDIVAPGTHVSGGVWQTSNPSATGTADPLFDGSGVSGGILGSNFFPGNGSTQQFYTASSGTSHSTPCVAGGAALVRQYFLNRNFAAPSPAMTKAFLMNSSRYLTGVGANDTLPSNSQGMGEMNLGTAFDGAARMVRDQLAADKFTATGQTRVFNLQVVDPAKPLRFTVAWTDAPGSTTGNAFKNDLDLTVVAGGNTYRGNVFTGANSVTGGVADVRNNAESVFLPAGISGAVTVTVTASSINSDGVPNDADLLDQDFALVAYGALPGGTASVLPNGATLTAESIAPANGLIDNGETVTVSFKLQNAGNTALGNLVATLQNTGGVTAATGPQTYGAMAVGATVAMPFTFTASSTPGGPLTATFALTDGVTSLGTVTFGFSLARSPILNPGTAVITAEGLFPNNRIDVGETVTVNFPLTNVGDSATGSLVATLRSTGGVNSPSGAQNYGAVALGASVTRAFTFTASGTPGAALTATFDLTDGATNLGMATFSFVLSTGPAPLANGSSITAESIAPPNAAIDPSETVTVNFAIQNTGQQPFGNLTATLQATGGVTSPSAPQSYGALAAGASATRAFTFTGTGASGSTLTATLQLQDGATNYGTITYTFVISQATFVNATAITINDSTTSSPYPSTIAVSGIPVGGATYVAKVTAKLKGLSHTYPSDAQILLVGPAGQKMLLMRNVGSSVSISNITLTFDDAAASALPTTSGLSTGTFRPTTNGTATSFQAPAPAIPYDSTLSVFNNQDPNGTWSLYVRDVLGGDIGSIAQGWELNITTSNTPPLTVTSTAPAAGGVFTLPAPLTYDVNFSVPVDPATVQTGDLVLSGLAGAFVSGVTVLPGNTTARFTISGITAEGTLTASIANGVIVAPTGAGVAAFLSTYQTDFGTVPFPTPLAAALPLGSLVYGGGTSASINPAGDTDTFILNIDPGQTITVKVTPSTPALRPVAELRDPANALIGSNTAGAANQNALIQTVATTTGGTYQIVVSGAGGTAGSYTVQVTLNAALENEGDIAGVTNGTTGTAQTIAGTFTALQPGLPGTQRGAVLGTTDSANYAATAVTPTFMDISTTGTISTATGDDSSQTLSAAQLAGFAFPFFGTNFTTIAFSTNGLITFPAGDTSFTNSDLSTSPSQAALAVMWDDLENPNTGTGTSSSRIYWQVIGSGPSQQLVVQWNNVRKLSGSLLFSCQAVLSANGNIQFNYGSGVTTTAVVGSATVGLKAAGTASPQRTLISFNQAQGSLVGPTLSTLITPPNPGPDYYAFALNAGETATVAVTGQSAGNLSLELRSGSDAILATGTGGSTNLTSVISNFTAATTGTYYARITGDSTVPYSLVVTRNAAFDTEGNSTGPTAQSLGGNKVALGGVVNNNEDWYSFGVAATGSPLVLTTITPGDSPGEFVNSLNPRLELYDPSSSLVASGVALADGRNERLQHTSLTTGTYRVRLTGEASTSGEYVLGVNIAPLVALNPSSQSVTVGGQATFNAAASGDPAPAVQWQVSTDGGANFSNIGGATSVTLSFATVIGDNGKQYRAVFSNAVGSATTTSATLSVLTAQEAWRLANFGITTNTGNAADTADPDGDGDNNLFEYVAGLDPNDPLSRFSVRVETVPLEPTKKAIIFRPLVPGRTYVVKHKITLTEPTWLMLTDFVTSDNVPLQERTVTDNSAGGGAKFYRVEITLPP